MQASHLNSPAIVQRLTTQQQQNSCGIDELIQKAGKLKLINEVFRFNSKLASRRKTENTAFFHFREHKNSVSKCKNCYWPRKNNQHMFKTKWKIVLQKFVLTLAFPQYEELHKSKIILNFGLIFNVIIDLNFVCCLEHSVML